MRRRVRKFKITGERLVELEAALHSDRTYAAIAEQFDVTVSTVFTYKMRLIEQGASFKPTKPGRKPLFSR